MEYFCFQIFILLLFSGLLQSCSETANVQIRLPAKELYQKAMVAVEDEFYQEALKTLKSWLKNILEHVWQLLRI